MSPERRQTLMERSARELAELFSGYEGKLLGTVAWRRMIGKPESNVSIVKLLYMGLLSVKNWGCL